MKLLSGYVLIAKLSTTLASKLADVPGHYQLWDDGKHTDVSTSSKGCLYEDLPTEYTIDSDEGPLMARVNGQWNCTTRDISHRGRNRKVVDMCNLLCDVGYGIKLDHLKDENGNFEDKYKIKSKRLVCNRNKETGQFEWEPAGAADAWPRCHNTCGDLTLQNINYQEEGDAKAELKCRNLGAIEERQCQPGINCHHAATCYPTCEKGFGKQNKPKNDNEMRCICTQRKCGWKIPDDIGQLGQCEFKMHSSNKRIIGGDDATVDDEHTEYQISLGRTESCNRKKRSIGESLIDHRRSKRASQKCQKWQHICGGVLLTAQWGVTAAHCKTQGLKAVLGEIDFDDKSGDEVPCKVRAQIRHPDYDGMTYHDIMMINMQCKKLKMGEFIWPARLPHPTADLPWGTDCTVCGWGTQQYPHYEAAHNLQCLDLPLMGRDECNLSYGGAIHPLIYCLGEYGVSGQDSCQGDSGGGAFCNGITYGLVMGGLYCADENYPGVYTEVKNYVPWFIGVIKLMMAQSNGGGGGGGRKSKNNRRRGRNKRETFTPEYLRNANFEQVISNVDRDFQLTRRIE